MKKSILDVLKERRLLYGKTQQQLANEIFVTQHTLSGYETGRKSISLTRLNDISEKLDGEIKFIPNEEAINMKQNTIKCYLENIIILINDEITKEILISEDFKEAFDQFTNTLWTFSGFSDSLGYGVEKISNLSSTKNTPYLNTQTKELDLYKLNDYLKSVDILKSNLIKEQQVILNSNSDISFQLFNLSENISSENIELISKRIYEFVFEYIESILKNNPSDKYKNYNEISDWFIIKRNLELLEQFSNKEYEIKTEIFIY